MNLAEVAFPADLLGLDEPERTAIRVDLVLAGPANKAVQRMQLRLMRRVIGGSGVELWGRDLSDTWSVHLRGAPDSPWGLSARVEPSSMSGSAVLATLDGIEAFQSATAIALALPGQEPTSWSFLPHDVVRAAGAAAVPDGFREVVTAHAHIEAALATTVPVPITYSRAEVKDTLFTAALLSGETVVDSWDERRWPVPADDAKSLGEGIFADEALAQVEFEAEWHWTIGDVEIPVGIVLVTLPSARLANVRPPKKGAGDEATLVLVPGDDDQFFTRLVRVGPTHPDGSVLAGSDQRWFWDPDWQGREAEVDELVAAGAVDVHDDVDALFVHLRDPGAWSGSAG